MEEAGRENLNPRNRRRHRQNRSHRNRCRRPTTTAFQIPASAQGRLRPAQRPPRATGSDGRRPSVRDPRYQISPAWRLVPTRRYFNEEFPEVNLVLRVDPMPLTAVMMTMLIPAAIRQYSIAVAPD